MIKRKKKVKLSVLILKDGDVLGKWGRIRNNNNNNRKKMIKQQTKRASLEGKIKAGN